MNLGWCALALSVASKYYSPHRAMRKLGFMSREQYEADRTKEDDNNAAVWWMYTNNQWKREEQRRKNKLETLWRRWDSELENETKVARLSRIDNSNGDRSGRHCRSGRNRKGGGNVDVRRNYFALHEIRKARNISAAAVAIALGISSDRYVKIEKNQIKSIKPEEMAMLSHFFNLPEDVLFKTDIEPYKYCSRCKTRVIPLDEMEKMLAEQFGNKLKPIKKSRP